MTNRRWTRWTDSIFGQLALFLGLGILVLQIANFLVVCGVQSLYIGLVEQTRAEHVLSYRTILEALTPTERASALAGLSVPSEVDEPDREPPRLAIRTERPDWGPATYEGERARDYLQKAMSDLPNPPEILVRTDATPSLLPLHLPPVDVAVSLSDGTWLTIHFPVDADDRGLVWSQRLFVLLEGLVMLGLLVLFLKRITKPIARLSNAVEDFGRFPEEAEPIPESGPKELRTAAHAFNLMREQIQGNLAERNRIISAMAHDLRTPLTKLQLRLDRVAPDDLREKLIDTASGMASVITQSLTFARSLHTEEASSKMDLRAFLESLVDDYADVGHDVRFTAPEGLVNTVVHVRPVSFRRCLENLITNACRYGVAAEVSLADGGRDYVVTIADRGLGIPEDLMERVFEPYFRVEPSRNRASGGTGLGLPIARNMARINGAELTLANRPEGGLAATLKIPKTVKNGASRS